MKKLMLYIPILLLIIFSSIFITCRRPTLSMYNTASLQEFTELQRYVNSVFSDAGYKVNINPRTNVSALNDLREGKVDVDFARVEGLEDENIVMVQYPTLIMTGSIFTLSEFEFNFDNLCDYNIGIVNGHIWAETTSQQLGCEVIRYSSVSLAIQALGRGHIDVFLVGDIIRFDTTGHIADEIGVEIYRQPINLGEFKLYMYLNRKHENLVPVFEQAIVMNKG